MISNLIEVYCLAANLTIAIDKAMGKRVIGRKGKLGRAEYITLAIIKQERCIKTTKDLYELVKLFMQNDFGPLPSYQQFCQGLESNVAYLLLMNESLAQAKRLDQESLYIIDSTALPLCKTVYSSRSKIGKGIADFGKNMEGWYFGFKLHMIINYNMDIVSFRFTKASTADITILDTSIVKGLSGYLIGDKGYLSASKKQKLFEQNLRLVTRARKNMKSLLIPKRLLLLLSKRQRVETVFGQLKDNFNLICRKSRSIKSFFSHLLASLLAYTLSKKSSLLYLDQAFFSIKSIS